MAWVMLHHGKKRLLGSCSLHVTFWNLIHLKQALRRFLGAAQLNFDFDADKLLMNCKQFANYLQLVQLCAISEQIVCKHRHTDKNTSCCTSRLKQTVQVYTKPVYGTSVHKTSLL